MGVLKAVFENANEGGRFRRNARDVNDLAVFHSLLALASFCVRLPIFLSR